MHHFPCQMSAKIAKNKNKYKKLSKFDKIIPKIFMYNIFVKLPNPQQNVSNVFYDICFFDFFPHFVQNLFNPFGARLQSLNLKKITK